MDAQQLKSIQNNLKYVLVLMLENRSFDHMLGLSGISGKLVPSGKDGKIEGIDLDHPPLNNDLNGKPIYFSAGAPYSLDKVEPGHEFSDVLVQLTGTPTPPYDPAIGIYPTGLNNGGFVMNFQQNHAPDPSLVMKGFTPDQLPVMNQLAKEFVICDHYFSSLPGPTWPNRFFVHAATSGGLDQSPAWYDITSADLGFGYHFDKGHIFKCLSEHRLNWRIYAGNHFPQSLALKGVRSNDIHEYEDLKKDILQPNFPAYTFIEPDYGHFLLGNYKGGNSQHPLDDVTGGEHLIKDLYETLRKSRIWEQSLLIITYDEHGGFYDHVIPPATAIAPSDSTRYTKNHFNFRQYGVRVPCLIISPLIERNLIDQRLYDHTSILATLEKLFDIGNLTERDAVANDFLDLITLDAPRNTPTTLKDPANSHIPKVTTSSDTEISEATVVNPNEQLDSTLTGFVHVAKLRQMEIGTPAERKEIPENKEVLSNRISALNYMKDVKKHTLNSKTTLWQQIKNWIRNLF